MSTDSLQEFDLLQAARCEDLKYNEVKELTVLSPYERDIVDKLKLAGAHLLQGARGVGKSQLLRQAEIEMDEAFTQAKRLSIYINFKTSPLLEGVIINDKNAFQIWVGAKILQSVHEKLKFLNLIPSNLVEDPYQKIFNLGLDNLTQNFLLEKIHQIQTYALAINKKEEAQKLGEEFINKVNDINFIRDTLSGLVEHLNIDRIIFLFDEVAHTFIPAQQEVFFEVFKLLHGNSLAVKAAVYPTVTSYGKNFEIGHDAILISLDRFDTGSGLLEMRTLFRSILDKRITNSNPLRKKIYARGSLLDQCIYMSSGNPRAFLHILLRALDNYNVYGVAKAIQEYVDTELLPYHNNVAKRLPRFSNHVVKGIELCRSYLVQEIKEKNSREKKSGYQSAFFTIDREVSPNLKISIDLLCYSGILTKKGTVKIAGKRTGLRYMVHLALMLTEKAFNTNDISDAVQSLSLTDYREFSSTDPKIIEYSQKIKEGGYSCGSCGSEVSLEAKFCSNCGSKIERTPLISELLDDSISEIALSNRVIQRIISYYPKVGDLLRATKSELMKINYIGSVRSKIILNAVEEYISG